MKNIKYAIILAGGKGERLRPFTNDRPKPMVEVCGKPILSYQLEQLKEAGIETVVFACSYQREVLQAHIDSGKRYGIKALFSVEETPLGRGGAIKQAMKLISKDEWENVFVANGDNIWKLNMPAFIGQHEYKKAIATEAVVPLRSPYGIVEFNKSGHIQGFMEKPILPHWINAGIYMFSRDIEPLLPERGDHETETFPMLPPNRFYVFTSRNYWRAVDTVKDLTEAEKEVGDIFNLPNNHKTTLAAH